VAAVRYDRDGDAHYDVISAFIKSLRGSDVDASLHWLPGAGGRQDPRFNRPSAGHLRQRDVGMADPTALLTATPRPRRSPLIGLPEASAQPGPRRVHLATAPKIQRGHHRPGRPPWKTSVPVRPARYPGTCATRTIPGSRGLGHGIGYRYPHDDPSGVSPQQYPPDGLVGRDYYQPSPHGVERSIADRLPKLRRLIRGGLPPGKEEAVTGSPAAGASAGAGGRGRADREAEPNRGAGAGSRTCAAPGRPAANLGPDPDPADEPAPPPRRTASRSPGTRTRLPSVPTADPGS